MKPLNVVMHINTVILLRNFSFGFINVVNLSTTFFILRFSRFFIFFIKTRFKRFLFLGSTFFYIYGENTEIWKAKGKAMDTNTDGSIGYLT